MSACLMSLPPELRLLIYGYVFGDNEPDEAGVFDAGDAAVKGSATSLEGAPSEEGAALGGEVAPMDGAQGEGGATGERTTPEGSAAVGEGARPKNKKKPRQIELLKAKDHYPQANLLATCSLICTEAKPVFEAAAKVFFDIDVFNVTLTTADSAMDKVHHFTDQIRDLETRFTGCSPLDLHSIKSLRFSFPKKSITIGTNRKGKFSIHRSNNMTAASISESQADVSHAWWMFKEYWINYQEENWRDADLLFVPRILKQIHNRA